MKNTRSKIITKKLENISREIFKNRHKTDYIQLFKNKSGVYALYDEKELYYVGQAVNLASRVKAHLKGKHSKKWTHFSVYCIKRTQYTKDIEGVIIRIANPKGNSSKPKIGKGNSKKTIRKTLKKKHAQELSELLGLERRKKSRSKKKHLNKSKQISQPKKPNLKSKNQKNKVLKLKGFVQKNKPLKAELKKSNKVFLATLLPSGEIEYQGKKYSSPSKAAQIAKNTKSENGWTVWKIQDRFNNWVTLKEFTKNAA